MGTYDQNNGPNNVDDEIKQAKKAADDASRTAKKAARKISSAVTFIISNFMLIVKIIAITLIVILAINGFQYLVELITAQNTPEQIYETLGVTDIKELVEIVGNDSEGYHLEYVDDIDEKIDQIIEVLGSKSGVYTINSKDADIIKKMIKAEVITQFPNLAGEYDEENDEFQGAVKIRRITPNKEIGEFKNTGTGEVTTLGDKEQDAIIKEENSNDENRLFNSSGRETIGDENRLYVIAIAAGHNNTDDKGVTVSEEFVEEEMTIKVAEKVEEICKKYRNLIVVQTGSTTENPGGVSKEERVTLAKEANPDLCIQIHFNSGEGYGVETYYEYGDGYSETLAQMVSNKLAEKMGLENRGALTNENNSDYYETIDSYYQTNFPSIITLGGFLNNSNEQEVLRNGGIDKYAEAIVEGAIEYLRADHSNESVTFVQGATQTSGIESRVYDLKYLPEEDFKLLVEGNSKEALKYFTLDESYNVITASWTVEGNDVKFNNNSPYNLRSTLQNVTMPYEYLLYFLIDSGNKEFVRDLADLVEDTEIIMAVQDNITTTKTTAEVQQRTKASVEEKTTEWLKNEARSQEESSFMEYCRTSVSITYADTWFVRYTKSGDSYSANSLGIQKDELVDKIVNVRGTVTEQTSTEEKGYGGEGPYSITDRTTTSYKKLKEIKQSYDPVSGELIEEKIYEDIIYTYFTQERYKKSIYTISNSYEDGESVVEENINKFVNLYNKYKMANCVKEEWIFKILAGNTKTANMVDLTKYLIFQATGISYGVEEFDFSEYNLSLFNNISASSGGISLTTSMFTKEIFVKAMQEYGINSGNTNFNTNFLPYAEEIYDVSVEAGVNPELVVVTAKTEQNFKEGGGSYNYWGISVENGAQTGGSYSSLADGIRAYANTLKEYQPGGRYAAAITQKYEERKESGCDPLGYGLPGTLSGMQSMYSHLGKHEYGSSGAGGYYYMDPARAGVTKIYKTHEEFVEKCLNVDGEHAEGTQTTPWEQGQYTAWQLEEKIEVWNDIFGKYGSLSSGGEFLSVAEEVWKKVCSEFTTYGGTSIPPSGRTIDCSAYVSWVLYEYGYTEFEGRQHTTNDFMSKNFNQVYGWQEISIGSGQNPINQLQPGDIFVRYGNGTHHMLIVKEIKDGRLLCYDCGDESNWLGKNGKPTDSTYFLTETGNGKIIRVTSPQ